MKEKVSVLVLISVLCSCIWLLAAISLFNTEEQHFDKDPPKEIVLIEKNEDEILYEKQISFFERNSIEIAEETRKVSLKYNVPIEVIYALIKTESDGYNGVISKSNCVGLTQISEYALSDYNSFFNTSYTLEECRYDIAINLEVGIWYYSWCVEKVGENSSLWEDAYLMFNVGIGYYRKFYDSWIKGINPINNKKYFALNRFTSKLNESNYHFNNTLR